LRDQEQETTDIRLSDLYRWQCALDVPIADLLVEPELPLSRPVMERAQLLRLTKTVMAIRDQSNPEAVQRLAQTMVDQLAEVMPELRTVEPWPPATRHRGREEFGVTAERLLPETLLQEMKTH
jgi:hypothetical protein